MIFRKGTLQDLKDIQNIISDAKKYLKDSGVAQWVGEYPSEELLTNDINSGESYVAVENGEILGTCLISFQEEPSYNNIYDGAWLTLNSYAVIHRLAVKKTSRNRNVASKLLDFAKDLALENNIHSLKIDTHKDNSTMKKLMEKNDFIYCGRIILSDNSERIAFEKILS